MYIMLNSGSGSARLWPLALLLLAVSACSLTPYTPDPSAEEQVLQRAAAQVEGPIEVSASVPSIEEARQIFGMPLYRRGIQPVWLEITNRTAFLARFAYSSVDPDYFSPFEVAYMHKKYVSKQGWKDMEAHLFSKTIPRFIRPGESVSGYLFTHTTTGTKSFNVDVFYQDQEIPSHEDFTFFITVPGFAPDHADVNFETLYAASELVDTDNDGLHEILKVFPCCTSNRDGDGQGMPVNIVLVATGREILKALLRGKWLETSYEKDANYMNNSHYLFGRPPDAIFRNMRGKSTERNELSLWLSPYRVQGKPVWMGLNKHAIGQRFKIGDWYFGPAQDPDVDNGRNYFMQNLWYSQSLEALAFAQTGNTVPEDAPVMDFQKNPFFTDGYRLVVWVSGEPVSLEETRSLNWDYFDLSE